MNPSLSIIVFTTLSGAGFGLIALIGLVNPARALPAEPWFGFAALLFASALATAGLTASTFHLGRPERAWRALSQWRSSWLSREGVTALLTFVPVVWFGIDWVVLGWPYGWNAAVGVAASLMALATIGCTAMIYASLKPIAQWHTVWVPANFLALALMTGGLWLNLLTRLWGEPHLVVSLIAAGSVPVAALLKERYWQFIDTLAPVATPESATGLSGFGRVRPLDPPHTASNYLLDEMGFRIARKHAARLRHIVRTVAFVAPSLLTLVTVFTQSWTAAGAALIAAILAMLGVLVERWLFFAEARHAVTLYYARPPS